MPFRYKLFIGKARRRAAIARAGPGGSKGIANIEVICRRCNQDKGNLTPEEIPPPPRSPITFFPPPARPRLIL
jgi:5-methylcytosine-specific restriction endonuclease McrA